MGLMLLFLTIVPDSCLSSTRRLNSSDVSTNDSTRVNPSQPTLLISSLNSELKLEKVTDVTQDVCSELDVMDSHENHSHDHASECHVHQELLANSSVSVPSRLIGTVVLSEASELALLKNKLVNSIMMLILRLLPRKLSNILMNLPLRLLHGNLKLKNGHEKLPLVCALILNV